VKLILETKCPLLTAAVGSGPGLPLLPRLVTEAGDAMTMLLETLPRTYKAINEENEIPEWFAPQSSKRSDSQKAAEPTE